MIPVSWIRVVATVWLLVGWVPFFASCGGGGHAVAQKTMTLPARGVAGVDDIVAPRVAEARVRCLKSDTRAEADACMAPWLRLERSLRATSATLYAAQASLDSWEHGGREQWMRAAPCVLVALLELVTALEDARVKVPPELAEGVAVLSELGGECAPGGET